MKKKLKRIIKKAVIMAVVCTGVAAILLAQAQYLNQFAQGTPFTTGTTNSTTLQTGTFTLVTPPIALNITVTNPLALITNYITVITTNTIPFFVFNAATMGTNFHTNFGNLYLSGTNSVYGVASQNPANTNGAVIE
jgi:hypothetical protein